MKEMVIETDGAIGSWKEVEMATEMGGGSWKQMEMETETEMESGSWKEMEMETEMGTEMMASEAVAANTWHSVCNPRRPPHRTLRTAPSLQAPHAPDPSSLVSVKERAAPRPRASPCRAKLMGRRSFLASAAELMAAGGRVAHALPGGREPWLLWS